VTIRLKLVDSLTAADLAEDPVWKYTNRDGADELFVSAVTDLPVKNLSGLVIGAKAHLANGSETWALFGNVDSKNPRYTKHFLALSVERKGQWFHLARYHDFDYAERGPEALSRFLGLAVDDVFPISFDLRRYVEGYPAALVGSVLKEPQERLSRAQLIKMAVP